MPASFKAFRIHEENQKVVARFEQLTLDDLAAGEVVVRVSYSDINYKDALAATGAGKILRRYPLVGGIDFAGVVESSEDARYKKGDSVLVTGCALSETHDGVAFTVTRGVTRPVWEPNAATLALYERARAIAREIGFDITHGSAGGGSDANFTGAMGIATLDGLGLRGAGAHTLDEHIEVDSLVERARLMAGLLATLD